MAFRGVYVRFCSLLFSFLSIIFVSIREFISFSVLSLWLGLRLRYQWRYLFLIFKLGGTGMDKVTSRIGSVITNNAYIMRKYSANTQFEVSMDLPRVGYCFPAYKRSYLADKLFPCFMQRCTSRYTYIYPGCCLCRCPPLLLCPIVRRLRHTGGYTYQDNSCFLQITTCFSTDTYIAVSTFGIALVYFVGKMQVGNYASSSAGVNWIS